MQKKSLAISNIVMLVAAIFCFAVFSAGAVWAYNANLAMKLPAKFSFSSCTLTYSAGSSGTIYSAGAASAGFTVTPVAANTLEISADYSVYGAKTITFTATNGNTNYTLSLVKAVVYDVVLFDTANSINRTDCITYSNGTLTLSSAVAAVSGDTLTFQIKFS